MMIFAYGLGGLAAFVALVTLSSMRVAQEYERAVVFRLGRYKSVRGPGLYFLCPLIEWQTVVDTRTITVDIPQQETITRDSVTIKVNAVLWYRVESPEKAVIAVQNYRFAVDQIGLTSLRNIVGQHVLDEVLKERNRINESLKRIVDTVTHPWGIQVQMVEMKEVELPTSMQRAMAREAEATREKRARIIKAEAEEESSVKLSMASRLIAENPAALELRRMQMISEVGAEQNTTTVIMMPSEFVTLARGITQFLDRSPTGAGNGAAG